MFKVKFICPPNNRDGDIKGLSFVKEMFHLTVIIQSPVRVYSGWLQVKLLHFEDRLEEQFSLPYGGRGGGGNEIVIIYTHANTASHSFSHIHRDTHKLS